MQDIVGVGGGAVSGVFAGQHVAGGIEGAGGDAGVGGGLAGDGAQATDGVVGGEVARVDHTG